jgi:hypothetical protein
LLYFIVRGEGGGRGGGGDFAAYFTKVHNNLNVFF